MKDMSRALRFGKSVHDNGWGMFILFLQYKLTEAGKQLVKVDKWFPSSRACSVCGKKKEELALSERVYICECGNIMDRDQNAAINIRQEGLRKLGIAWNRISTVGHTGVACWYCRDYPAWAGSPHFKRKLSGEWFSLSGGSMSRNVRCKYITYWKNNSCVLLCV